MRLTIRDVPRPVIERLRLRARRNRRSLGAEVLADLEAAGARRTLSVAEASQRIKALGSRTTSSAAAIRAHRDAG